MPKPCAWCARGEHFGYGAVELGFPGPDLWRPGLVVQAGIAVFIKAALMGRLDLLDSPAYRPDRTKPLFEECSACRGTGQHTPEPDPNPSVPAQWGPDGRSLTFICDRCQKRRPIENEQCRTACSCGYSVTHCMACNRIENCSTKVNQHLEAVRYHHHHGGLPP